MLIPDGYTRRTSSTIPFGYEETEIEGYLKPIPTELNVLEEVSTFIKDDTISLGAVSTGLKLRQDVRCLVRVY
jgi:hypothetical protein